MYIHNLDPVLLNIGPLEIRYYGLVYVFGFLLAYGMLELYRRRGELKLTKEQISDMVFYQMLGVLVGSRLFEVFFWHPQNYIGNWIKIFYVWEGGMAFHGGLIGIAIATWLFLRKKEIAKKVAKKELTFGKLADILSIPALIALAIGRIANFLNAELVGTVTNVKWCVVFPQYDNLCRHPSQIYSGVKRVIVLGVLLWFKSISLKGKKFKDGFIFWNMVWMLGLGRFIVNFYREDPRIFGLSEGQYLGILMIVVGLVVMFRYYRKDVSELWKRIWDQ